MQIRRVCGLAGAAVGLVVMSFPWAHAAEMVERAGAVKISGSIRIGDDVRFAELLARPRTTPLRVVHLHSGGGRVSVAARIGRAVRRAGLSTAVNGAERCESACTLIFAAGRQRHYFNIRGIPDRLERPRSRELGGLGYHGGSDANATGLGRRPDPRVTANMIGFYHEMGVSSAGEFVQKAANDEMFRVSGATALARGIATSLLPP
jgi:hypothetical protein